MSYSRRAQTVRRLTGGAMLALCVGLAIERAGAQQQQQQTPPGANVNVIAGTGADGDWTLQRQNEPSIACSSRNPRNCIAGANDYRTVDIPFPAVGERVTGDAWLGWYTTKDGGLSWKTRLLPGFPQDSSTVGLNSPLRGYGAGADPIIRPGTNGLFYYGGLVFDREEGGGSAIFVARFIDNNNQEGTAGEPIDYLGASIVHRIGPVPTVARRQEGGARPQRESRDARSGTTRSENPACAPASNRRQSRWSTSRGWPSTFRGPERRCARSAAETLVFRYRRSPADASTSRTRFSMAPVRNGPNHVQPLRRLRTNVESARIISRVPSADVNGDGIASSADANLVRQATDDRAGKRDSTPTPSHQRLRDQRSRSQLSCRVSSDAPCRLSPACLKARRWRSIRSTGALQIAWRQFNDGVNPDAIVTVQFHKRGNHIHGANSRLNTQPLRTAHGRKQNLPHQRVSSAGHRRSRSRLPCLVGSWVRARPAESATAASSCRLRPTA